MKAAEHPAWHNAANPKRRFIMGDKGKKDKDKSQKQKSKQHDQEVKKKQDSLPKKVGN